MENRLNKLNDFLERVNNSRNVFKKFDLLLKINEEKQERPIPTPRTAKPIPAPRIVKPVPAPRTDKKPITDKDIDDYIDELYDEISQDSDQKPIPAPRTIKPVPAPRTDRKPIPKPRTDKNRISILDEPIPEEIKEKLQKPLEPKKMNKKQEPLEEPTLNFFQPPRVIGKFLRGWQMDVPNGNYLESDPRIFLNNICPKNLFKIARGIEKA